MQSRGDRILTTHAGSLPRPASLLPLVHAQEHGEPFDAAVLGAEVRQAVQETVRKQLDAGVDVLDDGEVSKGSYATYVKDRLKGFEVIPDPPTPDVADLDEFPDFAEQMAAVMAQFDVALTACEGPVSYEGHEALQTDIDNLKDAVGGADPAGVFMSAASPGVIALFTPNRHYRTHEEFLHAVSEAMREEYEAIHRAGLLLQLDCPDLAFTATGASSADEVRAQLTMSIEALNNALVNIPPEAARIHVCWGNGEYPRNHDIPLKEIVSLLFTAKPAGLMVMGANGRHAHEWAVFQDVKLPDGKYLLPGVIDTASNVIEHPELIAQRLVQYASVVGRENVVASTDCGFASAAGAKFVVPTVAWAKLRAMADGAQLASEQLW